MLNTPCSFNRAADDQARCLPSSLSTGSFFSDAGCSVPLAFTSGGNFCNPQYASAYTADGACTAPVGGAGGKTRVHIYAIAGLYGGSVYSGTPASCSMYTTTNSPFTFYSVASSETPASTFVSATISVQ
jgi:hypothetical protein